ncbi:hypothetical protein pEaSNUABM5_00127 [Erwinia phage pEa_SNUABM_5]|uniref:Uncharacterized protein n=1 Tax=Erwinia phage pEa_SNUABM_5 TaxID=2797313 RepID=A0A7T8EPZ8_9CAUD|nr:hypothetical protein MPK73_gp127 [Erwinia phage pEa_SNUABM_5]QQO90269.1 hypothetical protein pEaSNUABM5_00127 [Erwinia phage pEa_SNUABM_5]
MLSLNSAWGTDFFPTQIEPNDLAVMVVAGAMNLTGARPVIEQAYRAESSRAAVLARPFADCAQYIQRDYGRNPNHVISILGNSQACNAIITDQQGNLIYDPYEGSRLSYAPNVYASYGKPQGMPVLYEFLGSVSYTDAVQVLKDNGYWIDNSLNWHQDSARAGDTL